MKVREEYEVILCTSTKEILIPLCLDHSNFPFRICFGFRYSNFGFILILPPAQSWRTSIRHRIQCPCRGRRHGSGPVSTRRVRAWSSKTIALPCVSTVLAISNAR